MINYSPYDPETRKLYPYVQRAFLAKITLRRSVVARGVLEWDGKLYEIVNPEKLRLEFMHKDKHKATVSFQEHTTGNYAVIG